MHALIENGVVRKYPYGVGQLKEDNPRTSFPAQISDETFADFGAQRVVFSDRPAISDTQVLQEATPVYDAQAQRWTQVWQVRDMTPDEIQQRNDAQADAVRGERNRKLAASDWTQVADAPVDRTAWAAYRQALRDITAQPGFPMTVDWPVAP